MTYKMPRLILIGSVLAFLQLSGCATMSAIYDDDKSHWFAEDKAAHLLFSSFLGALGAKKALANGQSECEAATVGVTFVIVMGAGKEMADKVVWHKPWSSKDMTVNVVGGTLGSLAVSGCH